MAETAARLARRTALRETDAGQTSHAQNEAVIVRLLAPRARFSLRIDPLRLSQADGSSGFADLPINRCRATAGRTAMRLGPDEWLLSGPLSEAAQIARDVEAALRGPHHALVDVGHARVALSVSGPRAADAINSGCALDLSAARVPGGHGHAHAAGQGRDHPGEMGRGAGFRDRMRPLVRRLRARFPDRGSPAVSRAGLRAIPSRRAVSEPGARRSCSRSPWRRRCAEGRGPS